MSDNNQPEESLRSKQLDPDDLEALILKACDDSATSSCVDGIKARSDLLELLGTHGRRICDDLRWVRAAGGRVTQLEFEIVALQRKLADKEVQVESLKQSEREMDQFVLEMDNSTEAELAVMQGLLASGRFRNHQNLVIEVMEIAGHYTEVKKRRLEARKDGWE